MPLRRVLLLALVAACRSEEEDPPIVCGPATDDPPRDLACTGLYSDFRARTIAPSARPYAPGTSFWSDGYDKSRYLELPPGATIDTSNPDEWTFPIGTKVWKEFRFRERLIETRLLWKVKADRWATASYVWSEDGKTAQRGEGRAFVVGGDDYTVPTVKGCYECHAGRKDTLLGIDAISLGQPAAEGITLASLVAENRLSAPPPQTSFAIDPGLAVLHVNCGVSCHNANPGIKGADSSLRLRLGVAEVTGQPRDQWAIYRTTLGVATTVPGWNGARRVVPGAPDESAILRSMKELGTLQMPPANRQPDTKGAAAVEAWIRSL